LLLDPDVHLWILNSSYDAGVALAKWGPKIQGLIFGAFEFGRIHDVAIDQRLIDIGKGELEGRWIKDRRTGKARWIKHHYSVDGLMWRHYRHHVNKSADTWRLRYKELHDVPLDAWPDAAVKYAADDAVYHLMIHEAHVKSGDWAEYCDGRGTETQPGVAFALHLMSCRGIRTKRAACVQLARALDVEIERCRDLCVAHGLVDRRGRKDQEATRDYMRGAIFRAGGVEPTAENVAVVQRVIQSYDLDSLPRDRRVYVTDPSWEDGCEVNIKLTKTGQIALDAEQCKDTHDPVLRAYATFTSAKALRTKTTVMLQGASMPLQTRYVSPLETGRTSSRAPSKPCVGDNFQNFRRSALKGVDNEPLPGQRECIVAREGYLLCSIDLPNAEGRAEAQLELDQFGESDLANALNAGENIHASLAAAILGVPYAEVSKHPEFEITKQFSKIPNFALFGGAAALTMIPFAKSMGIVITPERARELYAAFHARWRQVSWRHKAIKKLLRSGGGAYVQEAKKSRRRRYVDRYCQAINGGFQTLIGDCATAMALPLQRECRQPGTQLYGGYPVLFLHDEYLFEFPLPIERASNMADCACELMAEIGNEWVPDVPFACKPGNLEPALMYRLAKEAKSVRKKNGTWSIHT
jgi:hypothetical protein